MPPTPQQQLVIAHDPASHARVIAGPGTGKSWTSIALLQRLHAQIPGIRLGLLTFTRAATGELVRKVGDQGIDWLDPRTIHAYALRLLLRHPGEAAVELPLRIPDSWENKTLIRPDIARRLRGAGHGVDTRAVKRLEREMAARWEALDPGLVLLATMAPELRNAYLGEWGRHRKLFGYVLLAEIPFRAGQLLEDFEPDLEGLDLLIVDEYQDLNRADIRLLELLATQGVRLLAVGDDDQSIYGFRMAAPAGITEFPTTFAGSANYSLTVSMRCGSNILDAATSLIETAPDRIRRPRLTPKDGAEAGIFAYLRFPGQVAEARGVAALIAGRVANGVAPRDIIVLVRSNVSDWSSLLAPRLEALRIPVMDTEWVSRGLADPALRFALAVARLALDGTDSLAWWSLLHLTRGISQSFIDYVKAAARGRETFGSALIRLAPDFLEAPSRPSAQAAGRLVQEQIAAVEGLDVTAPPDGELGWAGWLINRVVRGALSSDATRLLGGVGPIVPPGEGLASFLSQLEPLGRDIATQADAVRIMSMASSKGLTANSAFVLGVEAGILPHPRGEPDEERRLLYVAMTRATDYCILTAAARRTGPTARHGAANVYQSRGRSPLLADLPIGRWQDGGAFVDAALGQ